MLWVRENCNMERIRQAVESTDVENMLSIKAVPYALLTFAAITLLVKYIKDKQIRPTTWFNGRPRSPDPEKPTDVNTFAEKRMKAADRPLGSMFTEGPSNMKLYD